MFGGFENPRSDRENKYDVARTNVATPLVFGWGEEVMGTHQSNADTC